jgi:hypothetical protein
MALNTLPKDSTSLQHAGSRPLELLVRRSRLSKLAAKRHFYIRVLNRPQALG